MMLRTTIRDYYTAIKDNGFGEQQRVGTPAIRALISIEAYVKLLTSLGDRVAAKRLVDKLGEAMIAANRVRDSMGNTSR